MLIGELSCIWLQPATVRPRIVTVVTAVSTIVNPIVRVDDAILFALPWIEVESVVVVRMKTHCPGAAPARQWDRSVAGC